MEWEQFWWTNITGPRAFIEQAADYLLDKTIVVLKIPTDLSWRHEMRNAVENAFKSKSSSDDTIFYYIDAGDECPDNADVGRFLLQRFAPSQIQKGYRERAGSTVQNYIISNEVLKDSIVWVKGLSAESAADWIKFCRNYNTGSIHQGLFILEIRDPMDIVESKRIKVLDFRKYVSRFDVQLFSSFILSAQKRLGDNWKNYIATLTARLCETDAEMAELYLRVTDFEHDDPLDGIQRIHSLGSFDLRGSTDESDHVLALWRKQDLAALTQRVWTAQVQTLFPIIEMQRIEIIRNWEEPIAACLSEETILQYRQQLTDPFDVELGTLVYLMDTRNEKDDYHVYIPDETVREQVRFLHTCRNLLAHATCCTPQQVSGLLR